MDVSVAKAYAVRLYSHIAIRQGNPPQRPIYRYIERPVHISIPHYRPYPVERFVDRSVPVPVEAEIEEEILYPRVNPRYTCALMCSILLMAFRYVRVPVTVPIYNGNVQWQYNNSPYLWSGVPPYALPLPMPTRYARNRPKVRDTVLYLQTNPSTLRHISIG